MPIVVFEEEVILKQNNVYYEKALADHYPFIACCDTGAATVSVIVTATPAIRFV